MEKKQKLIIGIVGGCLVIIVTLMISVLTKKDKTDEYPSKTVSIESVKTDDTELNIKNGINVSNEKNYHYYKLSPVDTSIQTFMSKLGIDLKKQDVQSEYLSLWSTGESYVSFDSSNNYLQFSLEDPIAVRYDLTNNIGIEKWMKDIFEVDQKYEILESYDNGESQYIYGNILLENIKVEFKGRDDKATILLILDNWGYLKGGSIVLFGTIEEEYSLPSIDIETLSSVINDAIYPKEVFPDVSGLYDSIDLPYISQEWRDIENSADSCEIVDGEIVYLYSDSFQSYLLPVYKLDAFCEVYYEEESYSVPAIVYTNAVSPEYISSE